MTRRLSDLTPEQLEKLEQLITDAAANASSAAKATAVSSTVSVLGVPLDNLTLSLAGLCVGIMTLAVNWYYRHKEYKLKELETLSRLERAAHQPQELTNGSAKI